MVAGVGKVRGVRELLDRLDLRLGQGAALAGLELAVVVREGIERDVRRAGVAQLPEALLEPAQ